MAKGSPSAFSWRWFLALVALGLLGLWLLKRPPEPPPVHPTKPPQARLWPALDAELRRLGIGRALRQGAGPDASGQLRLRLPRALAPEVAKAGLMQAARKAGGDLAKSEDREEAGLKLHQWAFTGSPQGLVLIAEESHRPALAILIDDWGYSMSGVSGFAGLPKGLSAAIFPLQAHSRQISQSLSRAGHEVLLHLPMEPSRDLPLVPGTLKASMNDEQLRALSLSHLAALPEVEGVNNHEGSKGTADARVMRQVLLACQERQVYFLDSLTSAQSVAEATARQMGVRTGVRQVFLDNEAYEDSIELALRKAARLALSRGRCIAIGHPHPATLRVLARMVPELQRQGIELVPVSELVR